MGRLSFAFGAFVNPPVGGVVDFTTSHTNITANDTRRMVDGDAMNVQLPIADGSETAQGLSSTHSVCLTGTAVLDQRVRKPIAKPKKATVRPFDQQDAGRPVGRPILNIARRGEAELGSSAASVAINEIATRQTSPKRDRSGISPPTIMAAL